jgi:hypothetical protein
MREMFTDPVMLLSNALVLGAFMYLFIKDMTMAPETKAST